MTDQRPICRSGLRVEQADSSETVGGSIAAALRRARPGLAAAAVALSLAAVLPPFSTYARQDAFAQAAQFAVFAVLTPTLLAVGLPPSLAARGLSCMHSRPRLLPAQAAAWRLVPFVALVVVWRLPAVLDALTRYPALSIAELVTLVLAGLGVWLALAGVAALEPMPRPLRAAMAAVAMWTIWIIAYITGMSPLALIPRGTAAKQIVTTAADRQLATAVLWAVPAVCFAPVVYYMLITWLGEREGHESEQPAPRDLGAASFDLADRAPFGWRHRGRRREFRNLYGK